MDFSTLVGSDLPEEAGREARQSAGSLKSELVPPDLINEPLNVVFHLMLMGFIASVGYKIASLGVMLVRPIKVTLKESSKNQKLSPG